MKTKSNQIIILLCVIVNFLSCQSDLIDKKISFFIPIKNKNLTSISDFSVNKIKLEFEQYKGFVFKLDTLYFVNGFIDQEIDFFDVINKKEINELSKKSIKNICFYGKRKLNIDFFELKYGLNLKLSFKTKGKKIFSIFHKKTKIGNLEYYNYNLVFIITLTKIET